MNRPTPTKLKLLRGNPGKRKIHPEPHITADIGAPPVEFTPEELQEWERVVEVCPAGMLKETDRPTLIMYCRHMVAYERAQREMNGQPLTVKRPNGMLVPHPLLKIIHTENIAVFRAVAELGFSPSARTRVHVDTVEKANEFDDVIPSRRAS